MSVVPLPRKMHLSNIQALILDPSAPVAVRVFEAEVVVGAEFLGKDIICK